MTSSIKVAILDDHQSIVDGYQYRLRDDREIQVVATAVYADVLDELLAAHEVDVLLLDVYVPTSTTNPEPFPILHRLPELLARYLDLHVLVISAHSPRRMIKGLVSAGARGYIVKDDHKSITNLAAIIRAIAAGGVYFSQQAYNKLNEEDLEQSRLTKRQLQVLSLCAAYPNETTADIGKRLTISETTVRNHLHLIYDKLVVSSRTAAVDEGRRRGLITPLTLYEQA